MEDEIINTQSYSPTVQDAIEVQETEDIGANETEMMTFSSAVGKLLAWKKIYKTEWPDGYYGHLKQSGDNVILMLHKPDGKDYQWILNDGDLSGDDYIVIE